MVSTNGCPEGSRTNHTEMENDPATRAWVLKAPRRRSPHCNSVETVGGGGLMVLSGQQRSGRYGAWLQDLWPSDLQTVTWQRQ
jgi:hypothetical protein